jgi:hypothetical protein
MKSLEELGETECRHWPAGIGQDRATVGAWESGKTQRSQSSKSPKETAQRERENKSPRHL